MSTVEPLESVTERLLYVLVRLTAFLMFSERPWAVAPPITPDNNLSEYFVSGFGV